MEQNTVQKPDCAAITAQARQAAEELLAAAHLRAGDIFVVGCSSSEIVGGHIGKDSSMEAAAAVLAGILPVLKAPRIHVHNVQVCYSARPCRSTAACPM